MTQGPSKESLEESLRKVTRGMEVNHKTTRWNQVPYCIYRMNDSDPREMHWPKGLNTGQRLECRMEEHALNQKKSNGKVQKYAPLIWGVIVCVNFPENPLIFAFAVIGVIGHFMLLSTERAALFWWGGMEGMKLALGCIPEEDGGFHNPAVDGWLWRSGKERGVCVEG